MKLPPFTHIDAMARLQAAIDRHGSIRKTAAAWGMQHSSLVAVRKGQRAIGPILARKLGLKARRYVVYRYEEVKE